MKTCACCGQEIRSTAGVTVQVDDGLLRVCNEAFEIAVHEQSGQVDLAHLVLCLARASEHEVALHRYGLRSHALADAARTWLHAHAAAACEGRPQTSSEFKSVLQRAQLAAQRSRRMYASALDVVEVLASNSRDLHSAAFVDLARGRFENRDRDQRGGERSAEHSTQHGTQHGAVPVGTALSRWTVTAATRPAHVSERSVQDTWQGTSQTGSRSASHAVAQTSTGPSWMQARTAREAAPVSAERDLMQALLARLDRYEQQLNDLNAQLRDARSGDANGGRSRASNVWARRLRRRTKRGWLRFSRSNGAERFSPHPVAGRKGSRARLALVRSSGGERSGRGESGREIGLESDDEIALDATGERIKRFYLALDDDIVRAPSIGNRTASRMRAIGLEKVREFLAGDPADISQKLGVRYITPQRITDWQAQARLVCVVPWLRGTHAQLLVGAGFATVEAIASADSGVVCAAILRFAVTRDGQSVLRAGPPPDIERVLKWVQHAALAEPARAVLAA